MGRVKQLFNEYWEKNLAKKEKEAGFGSAKGLNVCGIDLSDEELATFDKEFKEWLEAYEKSFGKQGGES